MKAKISFFAFTLFLFTLFIPHKIQAQEKASGSSASSFNDIIVEKLRDNRAEILQKYFEQHDSPLAPYATEFISQADLYKLDWTMLPAISGTESTFATAEPEHCYNSWGWDIYGDHIHCFHSYDEAIRTIAQGIKQQYIDKWRATDIYSIGQYYAASPTWASHTEFFMDQIKAFALLPENQPLPISP
ncbi:MAG TPA: hypothetical protein VGT05_00595 [Patescibacteria group bacterium]|nr:hypothetical protein [Patescibacteria group bacterium]